MKLRFSVIIPVYNTEKYLTQCLESVVNQTYSFDEIILINDGSTDLSYEICKEYALKYDFIKLVNQENLGQSVARNRGIEIATGDYILFLDSDDWLDLELLNIVRRKVEIEYLDALYFDAKIFQETIEDKITKNVYDKSKVGLEDKKMTGMEYLEKVFPEYYTVSPCLAVYKRSALERKKIRFPEGIYYEDNLFTFLFLKQSESVNHILDKLYCRRYRPGSTMTSVYTERKFRDYIKCTVLIWSEICITDRNILDRYKDLLLLFITQYCDAILGNYNIYIRDKIILGLETIQDFENVLKKYFCVLKMISPNYLEINLDVLNQIIFLIYKMNQLGIGEISSIKYKIINTQKNKYIALLKQLPLDDRKKKIGIYGTGQHTEGLLAMYNILIGKVNCDLVFIDSYTDNGEYKDKVIINYKEINEKFDLIIISSFTYEDEMINHVKTVNNKIPIYTFYKTIKMDMFSQYKKILECY